MSQSHYWIERIHKNQTTHIVVHSVDLKETMDELYENAYEELGLKIPDTTFWAGEEWKNISRWRNTIKFVISPAFTEQEMIDKGLIDDPNAPIELDEKVWGGIFNEKS